MPLVRSGAWQRAGLARQHVCDASVIPIRDSPQPVRPRLSDTRTSYGNDMPPTLIVNPTDDVVFADFAQTLVDHGATSTDELERRLRAEYSRSTVHARELVGETAVIWYVYREGRWIVSHPAGEELEATERDA